MKDLVNKMEDKAFFKREYKQGFLAGIPVGLGYLAVSFGFGITAVAKGLPALYALFISMTNLTSAGQVAGVGVIAASGLFIEMFLTQVVINARYALMGIALSQRLAPNYKTHHRMISSFGITDEIFAIATTRKERATPQFMYGLTTVPYIGWACGTLLGALAGQFFPESLVNALGIAIYSMFIAIVVPAIKQHFGVLMTVLLSILSSCLLFYVPAFSFISSGYAVIISALLGAGIMAFFCPIDEEEPLKISSGASDTLPQLDPQVDPQISAENDEKKNPEASARTVERTVERASEKESVPLNSSASGEPVERVVERASEKENAQGKEEDKNDGCS